MSLKLKYVMGKTIEECYIVASDGSKDGEGNLRESVIRASHLLKQEFHADANADHNDGKPKLEVQPEQLMEEIGNSADTIEEFEKVTQAMALANTSTNEALVKTAGAYDGPVTATEEGQTVKVGGEPDYATEKPASVNIETEKNNAVVKYWSRISTKPSKSPEIALDLKSKLQATEEELKIRTAEVDTAKTETMDVQKKLDSKEKESESKEVLEQLGDLGLVEDDKDREKYQKLLGEFSAKNLDALETILKDVVAQDGKPGKGVPKPGDGEKPPVFSSTGNIVHASFSTAEGLPKSDADVIKTMSELWIEDDMRKERLINSH